MSEQTTEPALTPLDLDEPEPDHDEDGDGCYDYDELGTDQFDGGLRDPFNKWDYFNPTNDGRNRSDDILLITNHYRDDEWPPAGGYDVKYDRTGLAGGNDWNLGPPNGTIRSADINAIVKQYRHDCGDGSVWPPKPTPWPTPQ